LLPCVPHRTSALRRAGSAVGEFTRLINEGADADALLK